MEFEIWVSNETHLDFADEICKLIAESAQERQTGIAKRETDYIRMKISNGNAVIALCNGELAGFCYIETWSHHRYVANSGLIVSPKYRRMGLAGKIKERIFQLSREKFPDARIFGITTSLAVMKINSDLGYRPVTFSELTQDSAFWDGCQSCPNYDILQRHQRRMCLCTAMLAPSANDSAQKKGSDTDTDREPSLTTKTE
jgi:hypothetical protein